jgi:rod shape determining protein RodA
MRNRAPGADYPLIIYAVLLSAFGVLMVYSAGQGAAVPGSPRPESTYWIKQIYWLCLGVPAAFIASRFAARFLEYAAAPAYVFALLLLLLTVTGFGAGAGTAQGTTSWLAINGQRVGQPSELAKIVVVLLLAKVLAARTRTPTSLLELWKPALVVAIPALLILKQRDLGSALVFFGIVFAMLYWSGVRWQLLLFLASPVVSLILAMSTKLWGIWFVLLTLVVISYRPLVAESAAIMLANVASGVAAPIIWEHGIKGYQRARFLTFLNPTQDPLHAGYNVNQSMTAIGSGGWFGQGFNEGTQKALSFIPEQHTDFIFSVLGEELGFLGVAVALGLFLLFLLRTTRVASRSLDAFSGLVAFGLTSIFLVHIVVNVGMTLNLVPVTGIPLPFFSYGGSFLLACWLCVGVLHRISVEGRGRPDSMAL